MCRSELRAIMVGSAVNWEVIQPNLVSSLIPLLQHQLDLLSSPLSLTQYQHRLLLIQSHHQKIPEVGFLPKGKDPSNWEEWSRALLKSYWDLKSRLQFQVYHACLRMS